MIIGKIVEINIVDLERKWIELIYYINSSDARKMFVKIKM